MITIQEFEDYLDKLEYHDWYYEYSDDGEVWRKGQAARQQLKAIAATDPVYCEMYQACHALQFREDISPGSYDRARAVYVALITELRQQFEAKQAA